MPPPKLTNGEDGIPSEADLVETVERLLSSAGKEEVRSSRSGRFYVTRSVDECGVEESIVALELSVADAVTNATLEAA